MSASIAEKRLAALKAKAREVQAEIDDERSRKRVLCHHCERRSVVGRTVYIQDHYYVEPYSCTGGDYWRESEGSFLCEKCGYENRLIYRPEIVNLKPYFRQVEKRHEHYKDRRQRKWVN